MNAKNIMNKYLVCLVIIFTLASILSAETGKNPTRAALYSAFLPGGGQIYNEAYVKAGIVIGIQGYLLGSALYHNGKAEDYASLAAEAENDQMAAIYKARRKEFQEMRTSDIWWMGITLGMSVLDAWVDAHLFDFDADKERIHLLFEEEKIQVQLRF